MWYNDASLLRSFGQALAFADVLTDSDDFVEFLAKPQKYNDAFSNWEQCAFPTDESDDGWDDFLGTLGEEENE